MSSFHDPADLCTCGPKRDIRNGRDLVAFFHADNIEPSDPGAPEVVMVDVALDQVLRQVVSAEVSAEEAVEADQPNPESTITAEA